jgi:hypothetical protein
MTILDVQSMFSDDQAITATAASTNIIDLGVNQTPINRAATTNPAQVHDKGAGEPTPILIQVTEAFDALTNLAIAVEVDDNTGFSSATVVDTQTILLAALTVGQLTNLLWLPYGVNERYVRLNYTVTGSAPTVGKITAGFSMGNQTNITGA